MNTYKFVTRLGLGVGLPRTFSTLSSRHNGALGIIQYRQNYVQVRMFNQQMTEGWPSPIVEFLKRENLTQPTTIQEKTLPFSMAKKDVVGIARTGSGKTLAFVIPAVMHVLDRRQEINDGSRQHLRDVTCLILSPTRELANQTASVISKFGSINSQILVGGSSRNVQINNLSRKNTDIVVATPGRLIDVFQSGAIDLSKVSYLVLDEADRMLDMGFEPQISAIIKELPKDRQTLMWSATWPSEIRQLANSFMNDFEHVAVDGVDLKANPNIEQLVEVCRGHEKYSLLLDYIRKFEPEDPKILIFAATKRSVDQVEFQLMKDRIPCVSLHGGRTQAQRDRALEKFRLNRCRVMVATDVAARGLDVADITHVINYDFPNTIEDYIHRIGRTARHTNTGVAVSFVTDNDAGLVRNLLEVLKENNQTIPPELEEISLHKHVGTAAQRFRGKRDDDYVSRISRGSNRRSFSRDRFSNDRFSNDRYSNDRYSNDRYSNDRYSNDRYSETRHPNDRYSRYSDDRSFGGGPSKSDGLSDYLDRDMVDEDFSDFKKN